MNTPSALLGRVPAGSPPPQPIATDQTSLTNLAQHSVLGVAPRTRDTDSCPSLATEAPQKALCLGFRVPMQLVQSDNDQQLQNVADRLCDARRIIVVTGAGVSTNCGIPDFRSKDGLYNMVLAQDGPMPAESPPSTPSRKRTVVLTDDQLTLPSSQSALTQAIDSKQSVRFKFKGQDLFHVSILKQSAHAPIFYRFMASMRRKIREEVADASQAHQFIRTLRDGGRLTRCYTQNIDGLEARTGLEANLARGIGNKRRFMKKSYQVPRPDNTINTDLDGGCEVVQLHGDLQTVRCSLCHDARPWDETCSAAFFAGDAPTCEKCFKKSEEREANGKRGTAIGTLRPNVVLYGEEHPSGQLIVPFVEADLNADPQVLIIMGTSLKVPGLQKMVRDFAAKIHSRNGVVIYVNQTKPAESVWKSTIDLFFQMDCDDWVRSLRKRREDLWLRQGEMPRKTTKISSKRKREECSAEARQKKKLKRGRNNFTAVDFLEAQETAAPILHDINLPTPSHGQNPGKQGERAQVDFPSTPSWQQSFTSNMYRNLLALSPSPQPPRPSPVRKMFKASTQGHLLSQSPLRPEASPVNFPFQQQHFLRSLSWEKNFPHEDLSKSGSAALIQIDEGQLQKTRVFLDSIRMRTSSKKSDKKKTSTVVGDLPGTRIRTLTSSRPPLRELRGQENKFWPVTNNIGRTHEIKLGFRDARKMASFGENLATTSGER